MAGSLKGEATPTNSEETQSQHATGTGPVPGESRRDSTPNQIDESQVVAWDDPVNELIDYHLEGLFLLYFTRAKYGNISTTRELIEA